MSRRHSAEVRKILPDPRFNDYMIAKFINTLMIQGKKHAARKILYGAMEVIGEREKEHPPLEIVRQAVERVKPALEVKSRRVGGSTYQVPVEVRPERRQSLGIRWIINAAKTRGGKTMESKLAGELMDAYAGKGGAMRKKEDVHKMAEANRAFAHFRW